MWSFEKEIVLFLMAVTMKISVFSDVTSLAIVNVYWISDDRPATTFTVEDLEKRGIKLRR
jgi:hypothetical protein